MIAVIPRGRRAGENGRRPINQLHTIDETAEILHVAPRTVRRMIDAGELAAHRFRRLVRISDADIALCLAAHRSD